METVEKELVAANETIDVLSQQLALSNSRINSFNPKTWLWLDRYVRYRRRIHKFLRPTSRRSSPDEAANSNIGESTFPKLIELANNELRHGRNESAAAVARMVIPPQPASKRLLSLLGPLERLDGPPPHQRAEYHLALAEAYRILGDNETAASRYQTALTFKRDLGAAHAGLAELRMPGDNYLVWLERLYQIVKPKTLIEIGVSQSASLARVPPPTVAIGIDPVPSVVFPLQTEAHIYPETSDDFFRHQRLKELLGDEPLSMGFIDGLHVVEQALRDFMNLESYCGPKSIILFHDTVPLDELTQRRIPETQCSTGDVWKVVLCLKHYRPDLDVFTIATAPTGLTVVVGLDPSSRVLENVYDEAVASFIDRPFSEIESSLETALNMVSNNWDVVQSRLKAHGVI